MTTPTAFITHSWDDEDHKAWVKGLAARLIEDGINVVLDRWANSPGNQLTAFMERAISDNDFVLVICTPGYKQRSDERRGGVGYEGDIITSEIFYRENHEKFIPILRSGTWGDGKPTDAAPAWLRGKVYIDLSADPYSEESYRELVETLFGTRETAPPIGEPMSTVLGPSAKWQEAESIGDSEVHANELGSELTWSLSACKESFITLGVNLDIATELANDADVGRVLEIPEPGLHLLLGGQGSGKTLASHRLFQQAIADVVDDPSRPFPIFLEAREIGGPVRHLIADRCRVNAKPHQQPVLVIVDGIDEMGSNEATRLRQELAIYADANPRATILATARPLPGLQHPPSIITLPELDADQTSQLIQKVMGDTTGPLNPAHWRDSVRESAKLPLFAIMIGAWLGRHNRYVSLSGYALVEDVAREALRESPGNSEDVDRLLQSLAVETITRGGRIRPHEVTQIAAQQRILTDSRLISENQGAIDFALPIFREWYAARAILEGTVFLEDIDLTSDRWTIPLSIVAHSDDGAMARSAMKIIAGSNLGMASAVLKDDTSATSSGGSDPSIPPDAVAIGEEIRSTMEVWQTALGSLFAAVGPIDREGKLPALGVCLDPNYLTTGWYQGVDQMEPVIEFPAFRAPFRHQATREEVRDWPTWSGRTIPETRLWSWLLTKNELVRSLKEVLQGRRLSYVAPEAVQELVWEFAADNTRSRSRHQGRIPVRNVLDMITALPPYGTPLLFPIGSRQYSWDEIILVRDHLEELLQRGEEEMYEPWPIADLPSSSLSIWPRYSDQRLLDWTTEIYSAALRIYEAMVNSWFGSFTGLRLASLLPVRIEGTLTVHDEQHDVPMPSLSWYPMILPTDEDSSVAFQLGPTDPSQHDADRYFEDQGSAFARLRGGNPERAPLFYIFFSMLEDSSSRPATELAHEWLAEDLKRLGWLEP